MMKLYGFNTINTLKVVMLLQETNEEFEFIPVNIRTGEQHHPDFRAVNPAGQVPVLSDGTLHQSESNSILFSLAKKTSWGLVDDPNRYDELLAWLFYQASTQGPHFGQIEHWSGFAEKPNPAALARHREIANRSIAYLNNQLTDKQYFCGETYTIADIALFPWLNIHDHLGLSLEGAENLSGWLQRVRNRPATSKARAFLNPSSFY
ncbi:glutathione S-transferase family protein [Octadecabacter sp. CECT 8868]|uniref:glutathione S-transferase family protein n=1 Tax=Octadecabacter algicola TaxID=2909342 RepID=UPI001F2B7D4F|nr:glutathione S-transferase family protein [Octadecabacter algicola]MCF2906623.1 glutathione S-transferase family protein [Octadecabacter algicola]